MAIATLILGAVIAFMGYLVYQQTFRTNQRKYPPGPKPLPIVGNIRDLPPENVPSHQHWLAHKDLYGGISSVTVMGMTLVIIHDKKIAHGILEQNAAKASGRPTMIMANKLCGFESIAVSQSYNNPTFRRYRKYLHQELGTKALSAQFRDGQEIEVKRQLVRALNEPEKWLHHCRTTAGATVLKMAYGYNIEPEKPDVLVELIEKTLSEFSQAAVPMSWAVDIIPALQYLPENFPGATFKKTARKWKNTITASGYIPYNFVQRQMASSSHRPSYVSKLVKKFAQEDGKLAKEDEEAILWTAASLYGGAADTTVATLSAFTAAMIKFPSVQRKAQEEIDRVVGSGRLPTFEDRENLPYVDALVKEAQRWWTVIPMGFPHTATENIEYGEYHIPKGAFLLPAVWWLLHDPEVYANPDSFNPDRYLAPRNEPDPIEAFGYGRRMCPGRFFADSSLYINMAQSLAAFTFTNAIDEAGKPIEVDIKANSGVVNFVTQFQFQIKPRSQAHVELIRQVEKQYPAEASDAELLESLDDYGVE